MIKTKKSPKQSLVKSDSTAQRTGGGLSHTLRCRPADTSAHFHASRYTDGWSVGVWSRCENGVRDDTLLCSVSFCMVLKPFKNQSNACIWLKNSSAKGLQ